MLDLQQNSRAPELEEKVQCHGWLMMRSQNKYLVHSLTYNLIYTALWLAGMELPWSHVDRYEWEELEEQMKFHIMDYPHKLCQLLPSVFVQFFEFVHACNPNPKIDYEDWSKRFETISEGVSQIPLNDVTQVN
jgi:hypothetical protein